MIKMYEDSEKIDVSAFGTADDVKAKEGKRVKWRIIIRHNWNKDPHILFDRAIREIRR